MSCNNQAVSSVHLETMWILVLIYYLPITTFAASIADLS